jgi:hypothetical protein
MKTERNYWIVTLALLMFFVTMISAQMTGIQNGFYYFVWMMVGYYGFKGNYESIKTWMGIAIIVNLVGLLVLFIINEDGILYISSGGRLELALGVVVMLIPKLVLYYYSKAKIESNQNEEQNRRSEIRIKNTTTNDFSKKSLQEPLMQKNVNFSTEKGQLLKKDEVLKYQPKSIVKGVGMENDHEVWERVLNEYEGADRKKGLWAKLFVELDGDEKKIKIQYLKIRVEQLTQESSLASNEKLEIFPEHDFKMEVESSKAKHPHESKNIEDYIISGIYLTKTFMNNEYYLYPNGQAAVKWIDELRVYSDEFYAQSALKVYERSGILPVVGFVRKMELQGK